MQTGTAPLTEPSVCYRGDRSHRGNKCGDPGLIDADALDRDGFVGCRLVIRERGCSLMLVSILSLALTLAQYVHAQTVRTRPVHPSNRAMPRPAL